MSARIHIIVDDAEKERFRRRAERVGKSLSSWLRDVARESLAAEQGRTELRTVEELNSFFAACDRRERGREPDWEEHEAVIVRSARAGGSGT